MNDNLQAAGTGPAVISGPIVVSTSTVEYLRHSGSDRAIAEAAWVSTDSARNRSEDDVRRILRYLSKHAHWTPFAQTSLTVRISVPIFVARQLMRHNVGIVWNEESRRYVDTPPSFFIPGQWRGRPVGGIKQGSSGVLEKGAQFLATWWINASVKRSLQTYNVLLATGVAPEQARMVLPLCTMTQIVATMSLSAAHRICRLRLDPHAQSEIRDVAVQISSICQRYFPIAWSALSDASTASSNGSTSPPTETSTASSVVDGPASKSPTT